MHLLRGSEGTLAGQSRLELEGRSNSRQWWGVCWSWIVLGTVVMAGATDRAGDALRPAVWLLVISPIAAGSVALWEFRIRGRKTALF